MRVHLKGIHTVRVPVSGGRIAEYHYAWRGGPRLKGDVGTPEFIASYNAAIERRHLPVEGLLFTLIAEFRASTAYTTLAERTRRDYSRYLKVIEEKSGDMPIKALDDRRVRGEFMTWRDTMAATPPAADFAWTVLARMLAVAADRGRIAANPCLRGGRIYTADRSENIWTDDLIATAVSAFPAHLLWVLKLALWTGQRQGDLLRLTWSNTADGVVKVRQGKTKRLVVIPIRKTLSSILAEIPKRGPVVLTSSDERPWTSDGFRASWRKACAEAGIVGVTFHDLRGSTVTRLAEEGAPEGEIAAITGHSQGEVGRILDVYLSRSGKLADNAVRWLERKEARTRVVKRGVKRSAGSDGNGT